MHIEMETPGVEPVTLEEAKAHLRVTSDDDDEYISSLISAAREWGEAFQGRSWITRSVTYFVDVWPQSPMPLPRPPIQEITSITYTTDDGEHVVPPDWYLLDPMGRLHSLRLWSYDTVNFFKISYKAGYGDDASSVPRRCKQAVLLLVGHWYENREMVSERPVHNIPYTAELLLGQERIIPV